MYIYISLNIKHNYLFKVYVYIFYFSISKKKITYFEIIYTIASRVYAALWIQPINLSFDLRGA